MDPLSILGTATGIIQPLAGLFKGITERRKQKRMPAPEPSRASAAQSPVQAAQSNLYQQTATGPEMTTQLPGVAPAIQPPTPSPQIDPLAQQRNDWLMKMMMRNG